ncbi:hypothetical protein NL676_039796 [Syzygium grande]|nr:hypothetical protein NL676_039796 [Syzygium grande]
MNRFPSRRRSAGRPPKSSWASWKERADKTGSHTTIIISKHPKQKLISSKKTQEMKIPLPRALGSCRVRFHRCDTARQKIEVHGAGAGATT